MRKYLFNTGNHTSTTNWALLVLRIASGGFMLTHGLQKVMSFGKLSGKFSDPFGIGSLPSLLLVIFAEVLCALCVTVGLTTRAATIPLIITMLVAVFIVHGGDPFGKMELWLLYLFGYSAILIAGPGKYSLDKLVGG